jgi:hypothetical protein
MLDNWALMCGSSLCSSGVYSNTISKSEDVLELLVLESVWVYIYDSFFIGNTRIKKLLMRFAWWINDGREEIFLNGLSSI